MLSNPPGWMFCCDPGLVSGVAVLRRTQQGQGIIKTESFEGSLSDVGSMAEMFVKSFDPMHAEIVVERFVITPRTGQLSSPDWSLKVCGVLEWLASKHWGIRGDDAVIYQGASEAKRLVPNEVLQAAGLWHTGGDGHARDALRHGLYRYATQYKMREAWATIG